MRFDWAMFAGGSLARSAAIPGIFLRLSLFPWTVRPGQAGWTALPSPHDGAGVSMGTMAQSVGRMNPFAV